MSDCPFHGSYQQFLKTGRHRVDDANSFDCTCVKRPADPHAHVSGLKARVDYTCANMRYLSITDSSLSGWLDTLDIKGGSITNTAFHRAEMSHMDATDAELLGVCTDDCQMTHADLSNAHAKSCSFDNTMAEAMYLRSATLRDSLFKNTKLCESDMSGSLWYDCVLTSTRMKDARIKFVRFSDTLFENCDFESAKLDYALFQGCTFVDPLMSRTQLHNTMFKNCHLVNIDLSKSNFGYSSFVRCDMRGANLSAVHFTSGRVTECDLRGASFENAVVSGLDFTGSDLSQTSFDGAWYSESTVWPTGFSPPATAKSSEEESEARAYFNKNYHNEPYTSANQMVFVLQKPCSALDFAYDFAPAFFETYKGRWAIPASQFALYLKIAIGETASSLRTGDGVMPFDTDDERVACAAAHLRKIGSVAVIQAQFETREQTKDHFGSWLYRQLKKSIEDSRRRARKARPQPNVQP